jgi:hypothetical protein
LCRNIVSELFTFPVNYYFSCKLFTFPVNYFNISWKKEYFSGAAKQKKYQEEEEIVKKLIKWALCLKVFQISVALQKWVMHCR